MVKVLVTVGLGLIVAASAAPAAPIAKSGGNTSAQAPETKYCLKLDRMTGSNIDRSGCRTKAEWRKLGIDIDDVLKS